uniref:Putative lipocalin-3 1 n=1 Tax=Amblyomma cajennense TaxID=34607 RepID=A0A023FQR0_AMBCJ
MADVRISSMLFAFLLTAVSADDNDVVQNSTVDVVKFLQQSPKLWVYNTTEPGNIKCRLDFYTTITDNQTSFSRSYLNSTRKEEKKLTGKFFVYEGGNKPAPGKYDAIEIKDDTTTEYPLSEEVFEFQSDDETCAIVAVLDNSSGITKTWLDLRVSSTAIESQKGKKCAERFEEILKIYHERDRKWRISYDSDCKTEQS